MDAPQTHQTQIKLELPSDLNAVYSNLAMISHSASEVILDFACILPNTPTAKICARIVTTPQHAKLLLRALTENMEKYEAQFGEIKLPPASGDALAQQLFSTIKPPGPPAV